jgi:hypothetical protein
MMCNVSSMAAIGSGTSKTNCRSSWSFVCEVSAWLYVSDLTTCCAWEGSQPANLPCLLISSAETCSWADTARRAAASSSAANADVFRVIAIPPMVN